MSVVFKEKHYDQLLILVNNLLLIVLVLVILLTAFNFIIRGRNENLKNELQLLKEEELKYSSLLRELSGGRKVREIKNNKSSLLISLADYADSIIYNSLHFKNNKINLRAISAQHDNIFTLIKALENDNKFSQVNLININQKENYYFEIETLIRQ